MASALNTARTCLNDARSGGPNPAVRPAAALSGFRTPIYHACGVPVAATCSTSGQRHVGCHPLPCSLVACASTAGRRASARLQCAVSSNGETSVQEPLGSSAGVDGAPSAAAARPSAPGDAPAGVLVPSDETAGASGGADAPQTPWEGAAAPSQPTAVDGADTTGAMATSVTASVEGTTGETQPSFNSAAAAGATADDATAFDRSSIAPPDLFLWHYPARSRPANVNSFLGKGDPHKGKYYVSPERYPKFLAQYARCLATKQRAMFLTENYNRRPYRCAVYHWAQLLGAFCSLLCSLVGLPCCGLLSLPLTCYQPVGVHDEPLRRALRGS